MTVTIMHGDCREVLATLPAASVQCAVTSPPYYGLRDYGHPDQIGLEKRPDCLGWATGTPCGVCYVCVMVAVFREVRRVLRDDGTLWLNLGDSYASGETGRHDHAQAAGLSAGSSVAGRGRIGASMKGRQQRVLGTGLPKKNLLLISARVALALQADGWIVRSEIVWSKAAPMPESVRDRPTCAHEKVWLLAKSPTYYYDSEAIREPASTNSHGGTPIEGGPKQAALGQQRGGRMGIPAAEAGRNARNVWTLSPEPSGFAHYAMMPTRLADRCVKAGSRPGDTVLDPFAGGGTTLIVADRLQRHGIGIELNPAYGEIVTRRLHREGSLFAEAFA